MSTVFKGESMTEQQLNLAIYKKYVDGYLSASDVPDFAKEYRLRADREYKSFVYLTVNYHGKSYHFKNGEVEIDNRKYSLYDRVAPSSFAPYGYIIVNNEKAPIQHSGIKYSDLSEAVKYKVNRSIGRAMAYIESKKLTSQISHFAEKTNSTNPPYDEMFDEIAYLRSDQNYRISSFKSYVKTKFDQQADIDFGHNLLNLYGLNKLIEYKTNIVANIGHDNRFYENVFEDTKLSPQQQVNIMSQNSKILKNIISSEASSLDVEESKIAKLAQITEETARGYLNQLSIVTADPLFIKTLGEKELGSSTSTVANNTPNEPDVFEYEFEDNQTFFTKNEYTVRQDSNGVWRLTATNEPYSGVVYSEDGCPVYDPEEERTYIKELVEHDKKQKSAPHKKDKTKERDDDASMKN